MSKPRANIARESVPPLIFMPEDGYNFPIIPFHLKSDADYAVYKRECENYLQSMYDTNPDIALLHAVAVGILRANISKRIEHAKHPSASVHSSSIDDYSILTNHGQDMRVVLGPCDDLAPHFQRLLYHGINSVEVGFRFVGGDSYSAQAFEDQQVRLNSCAAQEYFGTRFLGYPCDAEPDHKTTRIIQREGREFAVIKSKLRGDRLLSRDMKTQVQSRGRRTGVVDLDLVEDHDIRTALRMLARAGSDQSMSDDERNYLKSRVLEYLIGDCAYRAVFERYYFTREDVSEELSR